MYKKHLLVAASALLVGLSFGGNAWAHNDGGYGDQSFVTANVPIAASQQNGTVKRVHSGGTDAVNEIGNNGAGVSGTGLINDQQNAGANSLLQDNNTLAAILSGSSGTSAINANVPVALSSQVARVEDVSSAGAVDTTHSFTSDDKGGGSSISGGFQESSGKYSSSSSGGQQSSSGGFKESSGGGGCAFWSCGGGGQQASGGGSEESSGGQKSKNASYQEASGGFHASSGWHNNYMSAYDTSNAVQSGNDLSALSGTGMINVSQNVGNNSVLQSANTTAAIIGH